MAEGKGHLLEGFTVDQNFHEMTSRMMSACGEVADGLAFFQKNTLARTKGEFLPFENLPSSVAAPVVCVMDGVVQNEFLGLGSV